MSGGAAVAGGGSSLIVVSLAIAVASLSSLIVLTSLTALASLASCGLHAVGDGRANLSKATIRGREPGHFVALDDAGSSVNGARE